MSAQGIADAVIKGIERRTFDVMIVNFANADMVGHSGKIPPTIKAVEKVDDCLGQISAALRRAGGAMIVTADHGNAEQMIADDGAPLTAHTTNPVHLIMVGHARRLGDGIFADVAPTMLDMLGLPVPPEMTGRSLLRD